MGRPDEVSELPLPKSTNDFERGLLGQNVKIIKELLKKRMTCREIALKYNVAEKTINDIKLNKSWGWI